jgi:hypothetical protein
VRVLFLFYNASRTRKKKGVPLKLPSKFTEATERRGPVFFVPSLHIFPVDD